MFYYIAYFKKRRKKKKNTQNPTNWSESSSACYLGKLELCWAMDFLMLSQWFPAHSMQIQSVGKLQGILPQLPVKGRLLPEIWFLHLDFGLSQEAKSSQKAVALFLTFYYPLCCTVANPLDIYRILFLPTATARGLIPSLWSVPCFSTVSPQHQRHMVCYKACCYVLPAWFHRKGGFYL